MFKSIFKKVAVWLYGIEIQLQIGSEVEIFKGCYVLVSKEGVEDILIPDKPNTNSEYGGNNIQISNVKNSVILGSIKNSSIKISGCSPREYLTLTVTTRSGIQRITLDESSSVQNINGVKVLKKKGQIKIKYKFIWYYLLIPKRIDK